MKQIYDELIKLLEIVKKRLALNTPKEKVKVLLSDLQVQFIERLVAIHLLLDQVTEIEKTQAQLYITILNEEMLKLPIRFH
ncbi:MAG: hypothetical protein ACFFD2_10095 [Promethearchaeota archaeon]